jgi:hypothetical protein
MLHALALSLQEGGLLHSLDSRFYFCNIGIRLSFPFFTLYYRLPVDIETAHHFLRPLDQSWIANRLGKGVP